MMPEADRLKYLKSYKGRSDPQQKTNLFREIVAQCKKVRKCPHCEAFNGTIKKMPNVACRIIHAKFSEKGVDPEEALSDFHFSCTANTALEASLKSTYEEFDCLKVLDLFERIKDEDVGLFDMDAAYCRPQDLIITHIPVPPSCIRPSVAVSQNTTNEDDLTIKLAEILQLNSNLKLAL